MLLWVIWVVFTFYVKKITDITVVLYVFREVLSIVTCKI
jgi:hypothetical protein